MKKTLIALVLLTALVSFLPAQARTETLNDYMLAPGDLLVSGEIVAGSHSGHFGIGPAIAAEYELVSLDLSPTVKIVLGAGAKIQMRFGFASQYVMPADYSTGRLMLMEGDFTIPGHNIGQLGLLGGAHLNIGQLASSETLRALDLSLRLGPAFSYNFTGNGFHVGPDLILGASWYFKPNLALTGEFDWMIGTSIGGGLGITYKL